LLSYEFNRILSFARRLASSLIATGPKFWACGELVWNTRNVAFTASLISCGWCCWGWCTMSSRRLSDGGCHSQGWRRIWLALGRWAALIWSIWRSRSLTSLEMDFQRWRRRAKIRLRNTNVCSVVLCDLLLFQGQFFPTRCAAE
jgi:hypothetical protein